MPGVDALPGEPSPDAALPWVVAWEVALYGPDGFYRRAEGPAGHFRTSSHVPLFAEAIARLAKDLDDSLGRPPDFTVVDVGAGRGELLTAMTDVVPDHWHLLGVDVTDRPPGLDERVAWSTSVPEGVTGLLMAHELLDVVPCPVVEVDERGLVREVRVDPSTGIEQLGERPGRAERDWLERWWSIAVPGDRAEVGHPRDEVWRDLVARLARGGALAVDYAHGADDRGTGRVDRGTLVGHRRGRVVAPVPDGSCDLTAHVALDACAAAAENLANLTFLTSQREALGALGVTAVLPDPAGASGDPRGYADALQRAGQARELTDPLGLGGFGWLLQLRGVSPTARGPSSGR